MKNKNRFTGALLGLATGDAVGTTLEFQPKGTFDFIDDMIGGGPFKLQPGEWTDDTSMALCLAESLIYCNGFDAENQMNRYCNWMNFGYLSSIGKCFDIGLTVNKALNTYLNTKNPYSGPTDEKSAGNGSLMRLAPISLFFYPDFDKIIYYSGESSKTTHGAIECIDACKLFGVYIGLALEGRSKTDILDQNIYLPVTQNVLNISKRSFLTKDYNSIRATGYVINALESALWSFYKSSSFEDSILTAANLGDDSDTTAAICGQISGAFYGKNSIPTKWLEKLVMQREIEKIAISLMETLP